MKTTFTSLLSGLLFFFLSTPLSAQTTSCSITNLVITGTQCGAPNGTNDDDTYVTFTFDVVGGSGEYITFIDVDGAIFSGGFNGDPLPTDGAVSSFAQLSVGGAEAGDMLSIEVVDNNNQTCRSMISEPIEVLNCPPPCDDFSFEDITAFVPADAMSCCATVEYGGPETVIVDMVEMGVTLMGYPSGFLDGVAYNPVNDLYYATPGGNVAAPVYTFDGTGALVDTQVSGVGVDVRGMWWNPNTNQLEATGFGSSGFFVIDLDASGIPVGTSTAVVSPVSKPESQSLGAYDPQLDEVFFYSGGSIFSYSRSTGMQLSSVAITGLPASVSELNTTFVGYSAVDGNEAVVYNTVTNELYFIDKATGAFQTALSLSSFMPSQSFNNVALANGQIFLNNSGGAGIETVDIVTETVGAGLVFNPPSGTCFDLGMTEVFVEDTENGCLDTFVVTVLDTIAPVFTMLPTPQDTVFECEDDLPELSDFPSLLDATDNCNVVTRSSSGTRIVTNGEVSPMHGLVYVFNPPGSNMVDILDGTMGPLDQPSGSPVANLILTSFSSPSGFRRWRARNTNSFPVEVRVQPANGSGPVFYFEAPANTDVFFLTDAVGGANTTIIQWLDETGTQRQTVKASNNQTFPVDEFDIVSDFCATLCFTWTATDESGNSVMYMINYSALCDVEPPVIVCEDIDVFLDENGAAVIENDDAIISITDNCTDLSDITGPFTNGGLDARTFSCADVGNPRTITVIATDESGNTGDCAYVATVFDTIPPTIVCEDIDVFLDADGFAMIENDDAIISITDNCTDSMNLEGPFTIGGPDARTFGCDDVGNPRTIMVIATDESDNTDTCTYVATTLDTVAPTLECPETFTSFLDENGIDTTMNSEIGFTAMDACMVEFPIARIIGGINNRVFGCDDAGETFPRDFFVTDNSENSSDTCTVLIEVLDTISPTLTCVNDTVFLDAMGAASFDISALIVDTDDNCEVLEPAADIREAGCDDVNTQLPFTLTVEDPSGNSASCDVLVLVRDDIAPVITCPEDVTIECDDETEPGTIVMETASGAFATETAIPDDTAAGINTTATVSGIPATATIDDIRIVDFTMNHTWVGDLILVLTAPTGETLELVNRAGAPPGTFGDSSNSNVAGPISFDDAATDLAEDMGSTIGTTEAVCVDDGICTYAPNDGTTSFASLIADLAGDDPNGSWTINISDNAGGDLGTIFSWN
ncbi:MAG: hypothetical protein AAGF87_04510, partial [Bacteroidota bacterium]